MSTATKGEHRFIKNTDDTFMTNEQVADHIFDTISVGDKEFIKSMQDPEDMGQYHHGFGTYIRNEYGMWDETNPYSKINAPPDPKTGTIDDMMFPDQRSHEVLKLVWKKVHHASS